MSDSDEETSNELTSDDEDDPSELDKIPENDNGEYDMELYDNEGETYEKNGCMHPSLNTGDTFESVYKFREALREFAVVKKYELYFVKNDTKRVRVVCKNSFCNWTLHASLLQDNHTFEVKTIKGKHNCEVVGVRGNRMANAKWVCNKIFGWVRDEPTISAKCLRKRVKNTHRVKLSYHKVWRKKEMALEKLYGNVEESFKLVPSLQWELKERNPGSVIEYNANPNTGAFERVFVCFKACIDGFNNGCRRILFLDGCHLRGKYQGTLLAATALDGNFGIFPVAFAIVESESGHSWKWFLDCLVSGIGPCDGMTFMSNRLRGLDAALNLAFPRSEHRVCKRHFYGNFAKKYTGLVYQKIITKAAFAYHPDVFDSLMEELKDKSQAAHGWIDQQTEKVWTRSKFGFHAKCHYVTNNPAESFNKMLLEDRCRPMLI